VLILPLAAEADYISIHSDLVQRAPLFHVRCSVNEHRRATEIRIEESGKTIF
jgi:hypothetical protein